MTGTRSWIDRVSPLALVASRAQDSTGWPFRSQVSYRPAKANGWPPLTPKASRSPFPPGFVLRLEIKELAELPQDNVQIPVAGHDQGPAVRGETAACERYPTGGGALTRQADRGQPAGPEGGYRLTESVGRLSHPLLRDEGGLTGDTL